MARTEPTDPARTSDPAHAPTSAPPSASAPTTISRATLTLPAASPGPENPFPALLPLDDPHILDARERAALPPDMARQVGYAPLSSVLPTRLLDAYGRERTETVIDALVIENDRLRATVLPGLGGRVHSLHHKPTGRELLYTNPVLQPADFALNGAWFSGGIEWNIGASGHTTLSCAPVHAARVPAPGGGEMLRLWEWERLRDTPFQVDLWLPPGSDFLYVGARIRNPHDRTVPVYWWSNIAVPEDERTRVLAPAEETWYFAYERRLRRIPVPEWEGVDRSYPLRSEFPADYFYEVPETARKWIASLDERGEGLVQTSTDRLRGRKLFVWGHGPGGRRWQRWLTEEGTPGYAEIQAGLARTQLEHVRLEGGGEFAWLEAYGPLSADPSRVHGADWAAARAHTEERLEAVLPRAGVEAAFAAWRPYADVDPGEGGTLAEGSGWGALEVLRRGYALPGTPFAPESMGGQQAPWRELLTSGRFPEEGGTRADSGTGAVVGKVPTAGKGPMTDKGPMTGKGPMTATGPSAGTGEGAPPPVPWELSVPVPSLVSGVWRDLLECAPSGPRTDYHLGVAQWHAGDRAQAVRSWERSMGACPSAWAQRALALADAHDAGTGRHGRRAAERYTAAIELLAPAVSGRADAGSGAADGPAPASLAPGALDALDALVREAVPVLLAEGRTGQARAALERLPARCRERGRFRLLTARLLLAEGNRPAARAVFDEGFEVEDLREGDEVLGETWAAVSGGEPVPWRYEFRMRPA